VCVKQKHSTRARRSTQQRQLNTRSTGESGLAAPHSGLPPALALIHKPGTPHHPRPPHRTTCTLMPPNASAHLGRHDDACRLLPLPRTVPLCTYECLCVAHAEQAGERPAQAARPPPPTSQAVGLAAHHRPSLCHSPRACTSSAASTPCNHPTTASTSYASTGVAAPSKPRLASVWIVSTSPLMIAHSSGGA